MLYKLAGVDPETGMSWTHYALAVIVFNVLGVLAVYGFLRLLQWLPTNPQSFGPMTPDAAFNTAVSFATYTNWQAYTTESTVSYLTQMVGLTVQNFFSAATGIAVVVALIRGFARHTTKTIGNFWVDLTRITLYILAPLATVIALVFIIQGAIQNFESYKDVATPQVTTCQTPKTDAQGNPVKDAKNNPVMVDNKADKQAIAMGRPRRRKRSRCSAPMAAASSMRTRRIRTKTRRRSRTLCRWSRCSSSPQRCVSCSAAWWVTSARATRCLLQ